MKSKRKSIIAAVAMACALCAAQFAAFATESGEGTLDLRKNVVLTGECGVAGVTYSDTAFGAAADPADVTLGWTNETTGATGVLKTGLSGEGVTEVELPKKYGDYILTHSTGDLTLFAKFKVSVCELKIPEAGAHYTYVVSNETEEVEGELADGTNTYAIAYGSAVKVYFTPDEGYVLNDGFVNPKDLGTIEGDTVVDKAQMPKAERALTVANVTTATHWPWDGKIDITCDLTGEGKVQLSAALTTNGVKVCDATAANLTGETTIDLDVVGGVTNGVKFVWDAKADCPAGFNSTDTKVKVTAKK